MCVREREMSFYIKQKPKKSVYKKIFSHMLPTNPDMKASKK